MDKGRGPKQQVQHLSRLAIDVTAFSRHELIPRHAPDGSMTGLGKRCFANPRAHVDYLHCDFVSICRRNDPNLSLLIALWPGRITCAPPFGWKLAYGRFRAVGAYIADHQCVAVGSSARGREGGDDTAPAGLILDNDGLANRDRQVLAYRARHEVDAAAGLRGGDDLYRLGRIGGLR